MTTLAEHIIMAEAKNRPPMLEKSMYDSWASHDCDVQATNIILHGLPPDVYTLVNHQEMAKDIWDNVKLLMKGTELSYQERESPIHHQQHHTLVNLLQQSVFPQPFISPLVTRQPQAEFPQLDSGLAVPTFQQGEDSIDCINKVMAFLSAMASRGIATTSRGNYTAIQPKFVKSYKCLGEGHMAKQCTQPKRPRSSTWFKEKLMLAEAQEAGDLEIRGVASIVTSSSSSSSRTIYKHILSSVVSSSATIACTYSFNFCFLALPCSSSSPALLELFTALSLTASESIATKLFTQSIVLLKACCTSLKLLFFN
nr:integrase, catalytic region, zinc finger, CCHC-type, peptidase aspartic, catalytic [Tanacetum cinerariifolium]